MKTLFTAEAMSRLRTTRAAAAWRWSGTRNSLESIARRLSASWMKPAKHAPTPALRVDASVKLVPGQQAEPARSLEEYFCRHVGGEQQRKTKQTI